MDAGEIGRRVVGKRPETGHNVVRHAVGVRHHIVVQHVLRRQQVIQVGVGVRVVRAQRGEHGRYMGHAPVRREAHRARRVGYGRHAVRRVLRVYGQHAREVVRHAADQIVGAWRDRQTDECKERRDLPRKTRILRSTLRETLSAQSDLKYHKRSFFI